MCVSFFFFKHAQWGKEIKFISQSLLKVQYGMWNTMICLDYKDYG